MLSMFFTPIIPAQAAVTSKRSTRTMEKKNFWEGKAMCGTLIYKRTPRYFLGRFFFTSANNLLAGIIQGLKACVSVKNIRGRSSNNSIELFFLQSVQKNKKPVQMDGILDGGTSRKMFPNSDKSTWSELLVGFGLL